MRVCFFVGGLQLGGIGKLTVNLVKEFINKGISVDLFLLTGRGEYFSDIPEEARIFIAEGSVFKKVYKFIKYLNTEKPDLSISARQRQDIINIFCCSVSLSKTKPVISIHTNLTTELKYVEKEKSIYPNLARFIYKIPEKFIAVSSGVADEFSKRTKVERNNIKVIHNPIRLPNGKNNLPNIRKAHFVFMKEADISIVSAGRFTEAKDFFTLIKAFKILIETVDAKLLLLGDGPLKDEIESMIHKLNLEKHVLLTGYVNSPESYINEASVFVLSSKWEGFGNVLVEAMGVGTPVVSTNCPSGPAEILEDGKYGDLVPVGESEDMAKAIISALKNPIDSKVLIKRAKDFSVPKIADEYLQYILPKDMLSCTS